ncbi:hypothetical protein [Mycolicibacterium peregrinum]|uniref:hypothetical protein n=1 Tax=Mycolicibacterium peregrinum TaxID=43304 RepID=UPI003AABF7C6
MRAIAAMREGLPLPQFAGDRNVVSGGEWVSKIGGHELVKCGGLADWTEGVGAIPVAVAHTS